MYHGLFLLFEEIVPIKKLPKILGHLYTLVVVTCGFVVFRADTIRQGIQMILKMFTAFNMSPEFVNVTWRFCTPLVIFVMIIGLFGSFAWKKSMEEILKQKSLKIQNAIECMTYVIAIVLLALCMLSLSSGTYNPFIYFRF